MDERRNRAYRMILYLAMVDLRNQSSHWAYCFPRFWSFRYWRASRRQHLFAFELAHWLHNLAHFSALGFEHFDETRFWREHDRFATTHNAHLSRNYREEFERELSRGDESALGQPSPDA